MKFLIVDDSKAMQTIISRSLINAGYTDHDYDYAFNGLEALEKIKLSTPDMILCDWHMPEMTGIELLKELKRIKCRVKIGLVTTERSQEKIIEAKENGALFIVAKPFTPEKLHEAIEDALTTSLEGSEPRSHQIEFPDDSEIISLMQSEISQDLRLESTEEPIDVENPPLFIALVGLQSSNAMAEIIVFNLLSANIIGSLKSNFAAEDFQVFTQNNMIPKACVDVCKELSLELIKLFSKEGDEFEVQAFHLVQSPSEKLKALVVQSENGKRSYSITHKDYGTGYLHFIAK